MTFGRLERGWLALLGEGEYRAAVQGATGFAAANCTTEAGECATAALQSQGCASGVGAPTRTVLGDACVQVLSLREDFDVRAKALYDSLRPVTAH
jgi:hypothetical protein